MITGPSTEYSEKFKAALADAGAPSPPSPAARSTKIMERLKAAQAKQSNAGSAASTSATPGDRGDMSSAVLDGRLGDICQRRLLKHFPISYAWPALTSVAGVAVPMVIPTYGTIKLGEPVTNSFVGLIGPVHSGKSQAISWATRALAIDPSKYSEMRPASSEGLLKVLADRKGKEGLPSSLLINFDEWSHIFAKIGIQHSSFATFFTTAFDKRIHDVILAGGNHAEFECSFSFIGGIVEDLFGEIFGAGSLGGLHDRFLFGLCPDGFNFQYRPFEGAPEITDPIAVTIDPDVWEMLGALRKENPMIGREAEIAVRVAHICASFDGRPILRAKDCERSVSAFISEQLNIRDILRPNDGMTNDAIVSNAILAWMKRNAKPEQPITERKLKNGIRRTLARMGPGALRFATDNLVKNGDLIYGSLPGSKPYNGRMPKVYMLPKGE